MQSETGVPIYADLETQHLTMDMEEIVEPDLSRSFCANSDLFIHDAYDTPRKLSDEIYRRMAEFFRKPTQAPPAN